MKGTLELLSLVGATSRLSQTRHLKVNFKEHTKIQNPKLISLKMSFHEKGSSEILNFDVWMDNCLSL